MEMEPRSVLAMLHVKRWKLWITKTGQNHRQTFWKVINRAAVIKETWHLTIFSVIFAIMLFHILEGMISWAYKIKVHCTATVPSGCGEDDVRIAALCLWVDDHAAGAQVVNLAFGPKPVPPLVSYLPRWINTHYICPGVPFLWGVLCPCYAR